MNVAYKVRTSTQRTLLECRTTIHCATRTTLASLSLELMQTTIFETQRRSEGARGSEQCQGARASAFASVESSMGRAARSAAAARSPSTWAVRPCLACCRRAAAQSALTCTALLLWTCEKKNGGFEQPTIEKRKLNYKKPFSLSLSPRKSVDLVGWSSSGPLSVLIYFSSH